MPRISEFYGILIYMYYLDDRRHDMPHIHVRYSEFRASISITDGRLLAGHLPPRQLRLVQSWIQLRKAALKRNWKRALAGERLLQIKPLSMR